MSQVITGAQAVVTVTDGLGQLHTIGRSRQISVNSDFQRDWVYGIGKVYPSESPLTRWQGTANADQYAVLTTKALLHAFDMTVQDNEKFFHYLMFDNGINMLVTAKRKQDDAIVEYPFFNLVGLFITQESYSINENALSGRNGSFNLINPPRLLGGLIPESEIDPQ